MFNFTGVTPLQMHVAFHWTNLRVCSKVQQVKHLLQYDLQRVPRYDHTSEVLQVGATNSKYNIPLVKLYLWFFYLIVYIPQLWWRFFLGTLLLRLLRDAVLLLRQASWSPRPKQDNVPHARQHVPDKVAAAVQHWNSPHPLVLHHL
jgi:hypothetical protein